MLSIAFIIDNHLENNKKLVKVLEKMNDNHLEILIFFNGTNKENIKIFNAIEKKISFEKLKFSYVSREKCISQILFKINDISNKKYIMFLKNNSIESVKDIKSLIKKIDFDSNADLFEFPPILSGELNWKPTWRINFNFQETYNISKTKNVIAYSFPFLFNKIYKTSIIKKICALNYNFVESNSDTFIDFIYLYLLNSKTYKPIKKGELYLEFHKLNYPTLSKSIKKWNNVIDYAKSSNLSFMDELFYAKYYFFKIILVGFFSKKSYIKIFNSSNKLMIKKITNYIEELKYDELIHFETTNPYMFIKNKETKILNSDKNNTKMLSLLEEK